MRVAAAAFVVALSVFAAPAAVAHPASHAHHGTALCKRGYYKNVSGKCVHRPVRSSSVPVGATAECRDGTYSFSLHASGTCSHHGGVKIWIHHP